MTSTVRVNKRNIITLTPIPSPRPRHRPRPPFSNKRIFLTDLMLVVFRDEHGTYCQVVCTSTPYYVMTTSVCKILGSFPLGLAPLIPALSALLHLAPVFSTTFLKLLHWLQEEIFFSLHNLMGYWFNSITVGFKV